MVVPLCMLTCKGTCALRLFMHGAIADKNLLVQPESSIAVSFIATVDVGVVQYKVKANWYIFYHLKP
jgi:hypothetical protein